MPKVTRLGDVCTGHGCFPSRPSVQGSQNVFVNGIPVIRLGDPYAAHGCAVCVPHGAVLQAGSTMVMVNNRPIGRVGDPLSCGSLVQVGSPNVEAS